MADSLVAANLKVAAPAPLVRPALDVRRSEWVVFAFLLYAPLLASVLPAVEAIRLRLCLVNLGLMAIYALLIHLDSWRSRLAISVARDWLPLAVVLLAYREMGWFATPHTSWLLESHWVVWDRVVLRGGGKAAIEAFGPLIPSVLEIAYALVYALPPLALAALYFYRRRDRVDRFLLAFLPGVLLCYAQFPFWPSEPPRVVFAGEDLPRYFTVFRHFNLWMLGNYGIHTSVFPSAHVAGSLSTALGMLYAVPPRQWVGRALLATAVLIAVATVYGRYHYLADATAGILIAILAAGLQRRVGAAR